MRLFLIVSFICLLPLTVANADIPNTLRPELALQIGHTGEVNRVTVSPDGAMAASAELSAGTIKIWEARSSKVLHTIREPGNSLIWGLKFSPDGLFLAVELSKGIKLWNTRTGALERFLPGNHVFSLFLLNNGNFAFSPDGHRLVQIADVNEVNNKGRVLQQWNLQTGDVAWRTPLAQDNNYSVTFSPDGKRLIGLQMEENLTLNWDSATGATMPPGRLEAKVGGSAEFSADGSLVAFVRARNEVFEFAVCNVQTGNLLHTVKEKWDGFSSFAVSPTGNLLAIATSEGTLKLWNPRNGQLLQKLSLPEPDRLLGASFSSDGKTLISGTSSGSVLLYDVTIPALARLRRTMQGCNDLLSGVAYSPDGSKIYSEVVPHGESLPQLHEWDMKAGILTRTQKENALTLAARVALSPDGSIRASAIPDQEGGAVQLVQLLDAKTGTVLRTLNDSQYVNSLVFINGGRTIAGGITTADNDDKELRLWDVATGTLKQSFRPEPGQPQGETIVATSPDGKLLASAEAMGNIHLWDAQQQPFTKPLRTIEQEGEISLLTRMAFSPDSSMLAVASLNDILLIDVKTGQQVRSMPEHGGYVFGLSFSADGMRLASGGDGTVKIWNVQTSRLLATFYNLPSDTKTNARTDAEDYLVVTPEGYYAGSAEADRYVRFRLGDALYPAESFQARYYRPDLVKKALAGEELPPIGTFKGPFPAVARLSANLPDKFTAETVTVNLAATDDSAIKSVAFFVNGARVDARFLTAESRPLTAGSRALSADAKALTADSRTLTAEVRPLNAESRSIPEAHKTLVYYTATLPLPSGATDIRVQAIAFDDDGLQSPREELLFSREATIPATGKLLGLCVGISQYEDGRLNLKFADADAQELAKKLSAQRGLYSEANINALINEKATSSEVKKALDALIQSSTRADTVIISLSGHGWSDDERNFYFATHEVNRNDVAKTALPWKEVTDQLTQLSQKSKRVIILLDACHSGSAATNEEFVKATLAANAGVLVFASSRGREVSLENAEWGHGAFTRALLEAIEGKVAPDEKHVTMIDFIAYVSRRVKMLTQDQQHPQVPFLQDFDTDAVLIANL